MTEYQRIKVLFKWCLMATVRTIRRFSGQTSDLNKESIMVQTVRVAFLSLCDWPVRYTIHQTIGLILARGHFPSGLLSAGLAHGPSPCGSDQRPCSGPWGPAHSRSECGLAAQMHCGVVLIPCLRPGGPRELGRKGPGGFGTPVALGYIDPRYLEHRARWRSSAVFLFNTFSGKMPACIIEQSCRDGQP